MLPPLNQGLRVATCLCWLLVAANAHAQQDDDPPDWGLQLGGPAVFEVVYRPRIVGPLLLEVGAFAIAGGGFLGNASLGLMLEVADNPNAQPYLASGVGGAGACGEGDKGLGCAGIAFVYARIGLSLPLGDNRRNRIAFDAGAWYGYADSESTERTTFLIPMVGVGYFW